MAIKVPLLNNANYAFPIALEGTVYTIGIVYNHRDSNWYMDINASDGTHLLDGHKLNINVNLLRQFNTSDFPLGELYLVPKNEKVVVNPTRDNIHTDYELVYLESSEALGV